MNINIYKHIKAFCRQVWIRILHLCRKHNDENYASPTNKVTRWSHQTAIIQTQNWPQILSLLSTHLFILAIIFSDVRHMSGIITTITIINVLYTSPHPEISNPVHILLTMLYPFQTFYFLSMWRLGLSGIQENRKTVVSMPTRNFISHDPL